MCCSDPPPPPDLTPVVEGSIETAKLAQQTAQEQLAWSKEQFAKNQDLLNRVLDTQLPIMEETAEQARKDRAFYEETYRPLEADLAREAQEFDTEARREQAAGEAVADVTTAAEAQRENAVRRLEGYGIDPSQTRSQALDAGIRIQEAAAQAGAANLARRNVEATGRALRGEAINIGKGYAGNVAGAYQTAIQAGQGATGAGTAAFGAGSQALGRAAQPLSTAVQGYGTAGNIQNVAYGNQLSAWDAAAGRGADILGTGLGVASAFIADGGEVRTDVSNGGELNGPGGPTSDSIPAQVSDGEYVIPADVVKWKGLEHMEKMIGGSKKAMAERVAIAYPGAGATVTPPPQGIPEGGR